MLHRVVVELPQQTTPSSGGDDIVHNPSKVVHTLLADNSTAHNSSMSANEKKKRSFGVHLLCCWTQDRDIKCENKSHMIPIPG